MKELLKQMASYNSWANQKILDIVLSLPEDKLNQELPGSFKNLFDTVYHIWDAESIWWQRMKLQERIIVPSQGNENKMKDVATGLVNQSKQWHEWVTNATDMAIDHVFQFYNSKKEHFKVPVSHTLVHVFNHSTYHRGQLIVLLRQLGIEKFPQTDFIIWSRGKPR